MRNAVARAIYEAPGFATPWASLPPDRRAGWLEDADRVLRVVAAGVVARLEEMNLVDDDPIATVKDFLTPEPSGISAEAGGGASLAKPPRIAGKLTASSAANSPEMAGSSPAPASSNP